MKPPDHTSQHKTPFARRPYEYSHPPISLNAVAMRYLILFSLSSLFLIPTSGLNAQEADSSYFQQYAKPLDLEDPDFQSFDLLDEVVPGYTFFFTAEQHWRSINTRLQFTFLQYLHQKAGVRHLIVEGGYSYGFLLNEYLESGDERLLRKIMKDVPICPEDQMELYRKIHSYNSTQDDADKIQVTGIDLEHSPELVLQTLYRLLPEEEAPKKIRKQIAELKRLHESEYFDEKEVKKFFKQFDRHIDRRQKHYSSYWGDQFTLFDLIVDNTLMGFQFTWLRSSLFQKSWQERESQMYRNFLTISPDLKAGNYYAQFGALHTEINRSQIWDFPPLAQRLNSLPNSPVNGEVLTISRYIRTFSANYEKLGESDALESVIERIEDRFQDPVVLFSLIGKGSPFMEMSKNFQFMILIDEDVEEQSCE